MCARMHIGLNIEGAKPGSTQPVEVEDLGDGMFRVEHSPGFVEGIAAGDTIRLTGGDGRFEVIERGGNLAINVFSDRSVDAIRDHVARELADLGGWCDGSIHRAAVFTVPVRAGFAQVERVMTDAVAAHPGWTWSWTTRT